LQTLIAILIVALIADMYHLAQIPLGQPIHFVPCTLEEALEARRVQKQYLEQLAWRLHERD
jgi:allophanate hydrolase subunit 2